LFNPKRGGSNAETQYVHDQHGSDYRADYALRLECVFQQNADRLMRSDLRQIAVVAIGVMVAGYVMAIFADAPIVKDARQGFIG